MTLPPNPSYPLFGRTVRTYQVCGIAGLAAATVTALLMGLVHGIPPWAVIVAVLGAVVCSLLVAMATKIVQLGQETLIFYHHALAILAAVAIVARLAGESAFAWLDVAAPAILVFLAFGRAGCWGAACCHGTPSRRGWAYRDTHREAGLHPAYEGVPLWPVQLVEAVACLASAAIAATLAAFSQPGAAFQFCAVSYAATRLALECRRGDLGRKRLLALTQAQWISVFILGAFLSPWAIALLPLVAMRLGRLSPDRRLEIDQTVQAARAAQAIAISPAGLVVSCETLPDSRLYALSSPRSLSVDGRQVRHWAETVARLEGAPAAPGVVRTERGVHFVFVRQDAL